MNSHEIGTKLVGLFNAGDMATIYGTLYSPDIESIEASGDPRVYKGMEAVNGKNEWWEANFETHSMSMKGPYPHGDDEFAVVISMDITHKESGQRTQDEEVGVYRVADGKIVQERFFYPSKS